MLRVDVVYMPSGDVSREQVLDSVFIANVSGMADTSDYATWLASGPGDSVVRSGRGFPVHSGDRKTIRGHVRKNGWGPLVRRTFEAWWPEPKVNITIHDRPGSA